MDSPGVYLQNGNRLLRIYRVQSEHGGQFACTAENTAGEARRAYNIVVQGELRTTTKKNIVYYLQKHPGNNPL